MLSLARGVCILFAFSERKKPLRISELARITGLDRAVVRRCLYTLNQIGLVESFDKSFRLTAGILNIGHAYFSSSEIVVKSQECLDRFGQSIFTNCSLAIMDSREVIYLSRFQTTKLIEKPIGMGSRLPAYCTSVGRVLLAQMSDADLENYFETVDLRLYTEYTVVDKEELLKIIHDTRALGYSVVDQEYETGLIAIAIPIKIRGVKDLMSLSVTSSNKSCKASDLVTRYMDKMQRTSEEIFLIGEKN